MKSGILFKGRSMLNAWDRGALEFFALKPANFEEEAYWRARRLAKLNGHLRDVSIVENLIVNTGLNMALDMLFDAVTTGLTYHGIGTDGTTPAITNTTINTEVSRKIWSTRSRSAQTVSYSTFYLAAESTYNILEEGVFGDAATASVDTGTLFSHYLRPFDNSLGTFDLTFDYDLIAARG